MLFLKIQMFIIVTRPWKINQSILFIQHSSKDLAHLQIYLKKSHIFIM